MDEFYGRDVRPPGIKWCTLPAQSRSSFGTAIYKLLVEARDTFTYDLSGQWDGRGGVGIMWVLLDDFIQECDRNVGTTTPNLKDGTLVWNGEALHPVITTVSAGFTHMHHILELLEHLGYGNHIKEAIGDHLPPNTFAFIDGVTKASFGQRWVDYAA